MRGAGGLLELKNTIRHCGLITHARKEQFLSDERRCLYLVLIILLYNLFSFFLYKIVRDFGLFLDVSGVVIV